MERQAKNGLDVTMDAQRQADLQRKANIPDPQGGRNILQRQMPSAPLETQESVAETSAKATEKEKPLKKVGDKVKGWYEGLQEKYAPQEKEYVDPYLQKQTVDYRNPTQLTDKDALNRKNEMENMVNSTKDLIKEGERVGGEANAAIQNVEVPRSKLLSYKDIMNSDEFKGQRTPWLLNSIGTGIGNLLTGRDYQSYLKQHNQAMADTYNQNKALRDSTALQTNLEDITAGNKAEMGKQVQMSDAVTEQALKRYGLLEDQETKRAVLNEIISQATNKSGENAEWKNLNAEEKFAVMALQQLYEGDYSVATMFLEKYGDDFARIIDKLFEKLGIPRNGQPATTNNNEVTNVDNYGNEFTGTPMGIDGNPIPREEWGDLNDTSKYIMVRLPGQDDPVYLPVYKWNATKPDDKQQEIADYLLGQTYMSNEQKLAAAKAYDDALWWGAEIPGTSVVKKVQSGLDEEDKQRVKGEKASEEAATKRRKTVNDKLKDIQTDMANGKMSNEQALAELQALQNKGELDKLDEFEDKDLITSFNQGISRYTHGAFTDELGKIKNDEKLSVAQKRKAIENLKEENPNIMSTGMANDIKATQKYLDQLDLGLVNEQKLTGAIGTRKGKIGSKVGTNWSITDNGNGITKDGKVVTPAKLKDDKDKNNYLASVKLLMPSQLRTVPSWENMSDEEIQTILEGSPIKKFLDNFFGNGEADDAYLGKKAKDQQMKEDYINLREEYSNFWGWE